MSNKSKTQQGAQSLKSLKRFLFPMVCVKAILVVLFAAEVAKPSDLYEIKSKTGSGYSHFLYINDDSTYIFAKFDTNMMGNLAAQVFMDSGAWSIRGDSMVLNSIKCKTMFGKCSPRNEMLGFSEGKISRAGFQLLSEEEKSKIMPRIQGSSKGVENTKTNSLVLLGFVIVGSIMVVLIAAGSSN